jgi:predicted SprT family Zn-dependent metalloprotease
MGDQFQDLWQRLNDRHFDGRLPPIEIVWSRRLTSSAGMFVSHVGPRSPASSDAHRRLIRLSSPLLQQEPHDELVSTLAHEMIHQWQFDVLKRRPNHGHDFCRKMAAMNRDGLHITVHHALEEAVQRLTRYAWRCQRCGRAYERQRRTIRPSHHRCGACQGRLEEILPGKVRETRRPPSRFRSTRPPIERPMQLALGFELP